MWQVFVSEKRVIVVGAGVSGLAVAARLLDAGRDVLVIEGSARSGGQLQTWREPGLVVELGAEGFVARSRAVPALCQRLGIDASLVEQLTTDTYCVEPSGLVLLPPGEAARRLGFQVPVEELGRGIRSLSRGMSQLTDALAQRVGSERLRLSTRAQRLVRRAELLSVELGNAAAEAASAIVLATPARQAAELLESLSPEASAALADAPLLSNVSVNLLYRRAQFALYPPGSGLIFPSERAAVGLRALSLVEHKFAGRAPPEHALLRVFFRPVADALTSWSDERFALEASQAIAQVLSVSGVALRSWVSRWADALPVYSPDYKARVAKADAALQALGVHLAGSAFHGAGIDAAVASAESVAARLVA
jgi:protoporphyrinogen/coproporphyrinogen III oxidase